MIPIHVVARSAEAGASFYNRHIELADFIRAEVGQQSYFALLNRLITESDHDVVCVVHDDIVLPNDFDTLLRDLVEELNSRWVDWGLVGNAGVTSLRYGHRATDVIRYLADPHGGPNLTGHILPAQSIDGNVMLMNLAAMRGRRVQLPPFDGFQLYDIILGIETYYSGLRVLVAPHLACWHGSRGSQESFDRAAAAPSFNTYL